MNNRNGNNINISNNYSNNIITQTALNVNNPIYIPNVTYMKNKNSLNNNLQYPMINPMRMNNMGNGMMFGFNHQFVS